MSAQYYSDDIFYVEYPFVACEYEDWTTAKEANEFKAEIKTSWRPGVTWEECGPEDSEAIAHGMGKMVLQVVSTHKPGKYPERVFYTRYYVDPFGKEFGKANMLRVISKAGFTRLISGYRHPFTVRPQGAQRVALGSFVAPARP